jgi:hypothetical protein
VVEGGRVGVEEKGDGTVRCTCGYDPGATRCLVCVLHGFVGDACKAVCYSVREAETLEHDALEVGK